MPLVYQETVATKINGGIFRTDHALYIDICRNGLCCFVFTYEVLKNGLNPSSFVPQEMLMCLVGLVHLSLILAHHLPSHSLDTYLLDEADRCP